jgi:hypothetical protein
MPRAAPRRTDEFISLIAYRIPFGLPLVSCSLTNSLTKAQGPRVVSFAPGLWRHGRMIWVKTHAAGDLVDQISKDPSFKKIGRV